MSGVSPPAELLTAEKYTAWTIINNISIGPFRALTRTNGKAGNLLLQYR